MTTIPFSDSATATSDANGNVTFSAFQQPRMLEWRTGSFSVVKTDGTVVVPGTVFPITWKAFVGATIWGTFYNDQPSNLVQTNGPPVKVTGTNLVASTAYQCIFTGYDSDSPLALSPLPAPAPPPSAPQLLPQLNESVTVGTSLVVLGAAPVDVGTSISMYLIVSAAARVIFQWAPTAAFLTILETFTFDIRGGNSVNGLVLPNVGPFLEVSAVAAAAGTTVTIQVFTGLPPITQSPIVQNNVLWSSSGSIGAGTVSTIALAPYFGPVSFIMSPNNTSGFGIYILPQDYQGNNQAKIYNTQGWPAGTGPFIAQGIVYVPAQLCTLVIDNGPVGSPTSYTTTGTVLGP